MRRGVVILVGVAVLGLLAFMSLLVYVLLASGDVDYWEGDIEAFERRDISNPPPQDAILFVGGSDIRLWDALAADMAPLVVVRRGFGGAQLHHLTHYTGRIIKPYAPHAIVVMAGEEDLADVQGRTPEDILEEFKVLESAIRTHKIDAPIFFISIKPAPMRDSRWLGAKRANALIAAYAAGRPGVEYINAADSLIDAQGNIRGELFRWDGLTLNQDGYKVLAAKVRQVLIVAGTR